MIEAGLKGESGDAAPESLKDILTDPEKAKQALNEMAESEEEDRDVVLDIEGA